MVNVLFYVIVGALSGWIGYLASRTNQYKDSKKFLLTGVVGGLVGGLLARQIGMSRDAIAIDSVSIFNALFVSALFVIGYIIFLVIFEKDKVS